MEEEQTAKAADTRACTPPHALRQASQVRVLGAYSIIASVSCGVLLALLLSSTKRNAALQQETISNAIGSNSACTSCEDVQEKLDQCITGSNNACTSCEDVQEKLDQCITTTGELESELEQQMTDYGSIHNGETSVLKAKFDQCTAAKNELEAKCRVAAEQISATEKSSIAAMEETNERLNSSLIVMQDRNVDLSASNVSCFRSNVKLHEANVDLESQMVTLELAISGMNETLDSYMILTDELNEENDRLERMQVNLSEHVGELGISNTEYARHNSQLNKSLAEARQHGEDLNALNRQYTEHNAALSEAVTNLASEVDELKATTSALNATAQEYARLNGLLSVSVDRLEDANENLTDSVTELSGSVEELSDQNARLSDLNDGLGTIVSFLDETADGIEETYNAITTYLAGQISQNRGLLVESLANTYRQRTYYWICAVNSRFIGTPFTVDPNSPIGSDAYSEVVEYIDEILITDLCFDLAGFEEFVVEAFGAGQLPSAVTWNELLASVSEYVTEGVNYYFPGNGEDGLSETDWEEAGYMCEGLPMNKQFAPSTT